MKNPKLYIGAKIYYCTHFITIDEIIRKVENKDPNAIVYEEGMISFRFVDFVEYEEMGTTKTKIVSQDAEEYFFGKYTSLDDLKQMNINNQWGNAIYNIEHNDGIGMVTSPNGFHSMMPTTGIMINELVSIKEK